MGLGWFISVTRFSSAGTGPMIVLSLAPLAAIVSLAMVGRRGLAWGIPCLIIAAVTSALSSLLFILMFSIPT
jgi:hypothetical protein